MMNHDFELKLQAYLDGELTADEVIEVQDRLARDPEAARLLAELQNTNAALVGYEADVKLPESREFFWSKIQRQIEREEAVPATKPQTFPLWAWIQQRLVPVSGVAVALLTLLLVVQRSPATSQVGEIELSSNDMGSVTFRDQQEKVTVVWLYDRSDSEFTDADAFARFGSNE